MIDKFNTVKEKIKRHYSNPSSKKQSVKSLAEKIGHPLTSLYISLHELHKEGFLKFEKGLVSKNQEVKDGA